MPPVAYQLEDLWKDRPLQMVWPSLDSLSATTFSWPEMCRALRVTCFPEHQVRILHKTAHRGPDFIPPPPPPLLM